MLESSKFNLALCIVSKRNDLIGVKLAQCILNNTQKNTKPNR